MFLMYKILPLVLISILVCGCSTTTKPVSVIDTEPIDDTIVSVATPMVVEPVDEVPEISIDETQLNVEIQPVHEVELIESPVEPVNPTTSEEMTEEEAIERIGVVFAKTNFEGVLKTNFVRLKIVNQEFPERVYELHIGDKTAQLPFGFNVTTVNPGYFYIELPEGSYRFATVSIPVGTATATEEINVVFEVIPEQINYLGTLSMNGTKERIKLGGVPVIRPGFEYELAVINEYEEGVRSFQERYPNVQGVVKAQLMSVNQ